MTENSIERALSTLKAQRANLSPEHRQLLAGLIGAGEDVRASVTDTLEAKEKRKLSPRQLGALLLAFEDRFTNQPKHYERIRGITFGGVKAYLTENPELAWTVYWMHERDGEPDVADYDDKNGIYTFREFCKNTVPASRNMTYFQAKKQADEVGATITSQQAWEKMQEQGKFATNYAEWFDSPYAESTRRAMFGDRYATKFEYEEGDADWSHRPSRGWRAEAKGLKKV